MRVPPPRGARSSVGGRAVLLRIVRSEDEDDPETGGGPPPDPSLREWRHPSEIAAAASAAARDARPQTGARTLVPTLAALAAVTAVVGIGAVVASTMMIGGGQIRLSGGPSGTSLLPGVAAGLDLGNRTSTTPAPTSTTVAVATTPTTTAPEPVAEADPGRLVDGIFANVILPPSEPTAADPDGTTPAPDDGELSSGGVPGPDDGRTVDDAAGGVPHRLGGFAVIGSHVFTSAAAIDGQRDLALSVGGDWIGLELLGVDNLTDLAVFRPDAGSDVELTSLFPPPTTGTDETDGGPPPTGVEVTEPTTAPAGQKAETESPGAAQVETTDGDGRVTTTTGGDGAEWLPPQRSTTQPTITTTTAATSGLPGLPLGATVRLLLTGTDAGGEVDAYLVGPKERAIASTGLPVYGVWLISTTVTEGLAGTPVVDADGHLVGVLADSTGALATVVPAATMIEVAAGLERWGMVSPLWLGVSGTRAPTGGMHVTTVEADSPAERAGLQVDDVILEWGGMSVVDAHHLRHLVRYQELGDEVLVTIDRDGRRRWLRIEVGGHPDLDDDAFPVDAGTDAEPVDRG